MWAVLGFVVLKQLLFHYKYGSLLKKWSSLNKLDFGKLTGQFMAEIAVPIKLKAESNVNWLDHRINQLY